MGVSDILTPPAADLHRARQARARRLADKIDLSDNKKAELAEITGKHCWLLAHSATFCKENCCVQAGDVSR